MENAKPEMLSIPGRTLDYHSDPVSGCQMYLIAGRGETFADGLGNLITNMGHSIQGREIISSFATLPFSGQLEVIKSDLREGFWHLDTVLVGRSYGAYLLLHSLAEMCDFPGRILLFSPVLGAGIIRNKKEFYGSMPPRSGRLRQLAESNEFPRFRYLEIHTGTEDNGCDPVLAEKFVSLLENTQLHLVSGSGHTLEQNYVRNALTGFLRRA
ncbi:MAG: hypothetical protein V1800_13540 [Candidatus Latescibacterota bacterium]